MQAVFISFSIIFSDIEDVRGFIWMGYDELKNNEGDLSSVVKCFTHTFPVR